MPRSCARSFATRKRKAEAASDLPVAEIQSGTGSTSVEVVGHLNGTGVVRVIVIGNDLERNALATLSNHGLPI